MKVDHTREVISQQFATAAELTRLTGRPFTLDGHAVGTAGEVLAKIRFGLELTDPSTEGIDATARDGRVLRPPCRRTRADRLTWSP